jgi:ArsR family transcriptional regulator, virulence genes transcriptional regulator
MILPNYIVAMIRNFIKKEPADKECGPEDLRLWEMQADICQTLANPKRLQILNLLQKGEFSVGAMVEALKVAKANLSQHLSVMRQKGILATRREGTMIYYRLATPRITEACKIMRQVLLEVLVAKEAFSQTLTSGNGPGATTSTEEGENG